MNAVVNAAVLQAISLLSGLILGSGVFERILARVEYWAEEEISSAQKRHNVLSDLTVIGLELTESLARLGIELSVAYLKRTQK